MIEFLVLISVKIIAVLVGFRYIRFLTLPYRLVILQLLLAITVESAGWYIANVLHHYNTWLFLVYMLVCEVYLLGIVAYYILGAKPVRRIIIPCLLLITAVWQYGIYSMGINLYYMPFVLLAAVFIIIVYFLVLYYSFLEKDKLRRQPAVWLSISLIIFWAGLVPFYGFFNYMRYYYPEVLEALFEPIIQGLNYIRYPMTAVALYYAGKQGKAARITPTFSNPI